MLNCFEHKSMDFYSQVASFQFQQPIFMRTFLTPLQFLQSLEEKLNERSLLFQIIYAKFLVIGFSSTKVLLHSLLFLFILLSPSSL